ncbi:AIR synthase related protein [Staphylococcus aureus]
MEGTNKAIASTIDGEARYVYNNPYEGGKMVVAEAYRNLIAVGATPLYQILFKLWFLRQERNLSTVDRFNEGMAEA